MVKIEEYILLPLEERQSHLRLNEPCIIRGSEKCVSDYMRGVLADRFDTSYPVGQTVHACHACGNGSCSNFHHVYWGTPRENGLDSKRDGSRPLVFDSMVKKYGREKALEIVRAAARLGGRGNRRKETILVGG